MEKSAVSEFSKGFIFYNRMIRFVKVSILLHIMSVGGLILLIGFGQCTLSALEQSHTLFFICYGYLSIVGIFLIFFAQMDALSRFQNYKQAKDLFFENGFQKRFVTIFANSRCQREAIKIAAQDMGIADELNRYFAILGYRWFHLIPNIVYSNPRILLTNRYWKKTLFVKPYTSKYFLW
jgi:hypothetical protein